MDGQRLHADLRRAAAHRRRARRPLRPPADVRHRPRRSSPSPPPRAALAPTHRRADRARAPAGRRRARSSRRSPDAALDGVPAGEARPGARRLVGHLGLGVALGPLVGGAVVEGISWHWIFWLNVPIGLVLAPLAYRRLDRDLRPGRPARPRRARASAALGLLGIVYGIVRGAELGWTSSTVLSSLLAGAIAAGRVRHLGAARRGADAADALLPLPRLRRLQRRVVRDVLRRLRLDLPARPVLPGHAGHVPAGGRPAHAARGPAMPMLVAPIAGPAVGPHRLAPADGRPGWRCRRSRSAGWRSSSTPDRRLLARS